ncbi:MAG: hypothetical protein KDD55_05625 [Bdellovibrionales bacterium]|nr:hypothetical protein [Bdellovibrionales bacterium]
MSSSIGRYLTVFDGESEELEMLYELSSFALEKFVEHFEPCAQSDPEMFDRYSVGPDDIPFLRSFLKDEIEFDFSKFAYFLEAVEKDV